MAEIYKFPNEDQEPTKEKKNIPTWKIIVWGLGFVFIEIYGIVSLYCDIVNYFRTHF